MIVFELPVSGTRSYGTRSALAGAVSLSLNVQQQVDCSGFT